MSLKISIIDIQQLRLSSEDCDIFYVIKIYSDRIRTELVCLCLRAKRQWFLFRYSNARFLTICSFLKALPNIFLNVVSLITES